MTRDQQLVCFISLKHKVRYIIVKSVCLCLFQQKFGPLDNMFGQGLSISSDTIRASAWDSDNGDDEAVIVSIDCANDDLSKSRFFQ